MSKIWILYNKSPLNIHRVPSYCSKCNHFCSLQEVFYQNDSLFNSIHLLLNSDGPTAWCCCYMFFTFICCTSAFSSLPLLHTFCTILCQSDIKAFLQHHGVGEQFTWHGGCVRAASGGGRGACTAGGRSGRFWRWPTPERRWPSPAGAAAWSDSAAPRCLRLSSGTCLVTKTKITASRANSNCPRNDDESLQLQRSLKWERKTDLIWFLWWKVINM